MLERKLRNLKKPMKMEEINLGDALLFYSQGEEEMVEGVVVYLPEKKESDVFVVKNLFAESIRTLHFYEDEFYQIY